MDLAHDADEVFRAKFTLLPNIIRDWTDGLIDLSTSKILDFGCGHGITALSMASSYRSARVVGIDIMPDPAGCLALARANLGIEVLPENLFFYQVNPAEFPEAEGPYDFVYSWSAFEHISQDLLPDILTQLRDRLAVGGMMLIQIAPLFYSAEGSHLFHKVPVPWGHLLTQEDIYYRQLVHASESQDELNALWSTYQTLNRITVDTLADVVRGAGFKILKTYTSRCAQQPEKKLLSIFHEEVLRTEQVVLLLGHNSASLSSRRLSLGGMLA